jgi:ubiquitin-protein ligase
MDVSVAIAYSGVKGFVMRSFRDQRLLNDYEELIQLQQNLNWGGQTKLDVQAVGSKPYQAYNLIFHCLGYVDEFGGLGRRHQLFLEFPRAYPMEAPPTIKRVSPLFHPNIYPHGVFCLGFEGERKWRPGNSLESLILHVSRLIRFDPDWFNLDPPANRTADFWKAFISKVTLPADRDPFVVGDKARPSTTTQVEPVKNVTGPPTSRPNVRIEPIKVSARTSVQKSETRSTRPSGPIRVTRDRRQS